MDVVFYTNFNKRKNSTKIPNGGNTISVRLKDKCSILSPIIEIDTSPSGYTYAYIANFGRYYFIENWEYYRGVWTAYLSIDVCATYKSSITSYTCYIERAKDGYNSDIPDNLLSMEQKLVDVRARNETVGMNDSGCYVVRVAGSSSATSVSGVDTYAMTPNQLGALLSFLYNENNFTDLFAEEFVKAIFNPIDYILSVKWFPFSTGTLGGSATTVWAGYWDTGVSANLLTKFGGVIEFNAEPFSAYYGDWRDRHPAFTQYELFVPSFGVVDIPPEVMAYGGGLGIMASVDYTTGQFVNYINIGSSGATANSGNLTTVNSTIGYDVQISSQSSNIQGIASGIGGIASSLLSGNISGAINQGIETARASTNPTTKTVGTCGGIQGIRNRPWYTLTRRVFGSASYPTNTSGRPVCKNASIGSFSGYVKCGNASISINAYDTEREKVNAILNSGIYIE